MATRMTKLEGKFHTLWQQQFAEIELEFDVRFLEERRFRADFLHRESKTIIEVQGGTWIKGGHSTGTGMKRDATKSLLAANEGWQIIPLTSGMLNAENIRLVKNVIELRSNKE